MLDVAVDIRRSSPTFDKWGDESLSAKIKRMRWVTEGFAHGFQVTSNQEEFLI